MLKITPSLALALEMHDAVTVVSPRGWHAVRLRLGRNARGELHVVELTTEVDADPPPPRPDLGLEPGMYHGVINAVLNDLAALEPRWDGTRVRVEHDANLALDNADGTHAATLTLEDEARRALLFTDALVQAMVEGAAEIARRQEALAERIAAHDQWDFDQATHVLSLSKGVLPWASFIAEPIGTFALESETWLWAWANGSLPPRGGSPLLKMRDEARAHGGLGAFTRPSLPCPEAFATRLAGLASLRMGATGIYGAPFGPGVMFLALMRPAP